VAQAHDTPVRPEALCLTANSAPEEAVTVDAIDQKIIAELTRNARVSYAELASQVLLSRNAVRQRIERLERQGHIAGYTIVRAGDGTGDAVSAVVLVYRQDRLRGGDVLAALKRIPEVVICEILSGDFDIMVRVEAGSLERVRGVWEDIARMPGVRDTVTALTLSSVVNRRRAPRPPAG
jgi:DNA-binding Lrp family transcriptional regulator